jgi:hypothetical protein
MSWTLMRMRAADRRALWSVTFSLPGGMANVGVKSQEIGGLPKVLLTPLS